MKMAFVRWVPLSVFLFTIITYPTAALDDCSSCHGHGTLAYNGSHYCRCTCETITNVSASGQKEYAVYVPPDCRFTSAQVEPMIVVVNASLRTFVWPAFASALLAGVGIDPRTSVVYRTAMQNLSATAFSITFEFRSNGLDISTLPPATYAKQQLKTAFATSAAWLLELSIIDAREKLRAESAANTDPSIAAVIGGQEIALETLLAVIALIMIPFTLLFVDLIATDNFIASAEEGEKLLAEYDLGRGGAADGAASPKAAVPVQPRDAWLSDADAIPMHEPTPAQPLQRKGTRSLKDYSAKFYAAAHDPAEDETPHPCTPGEV